MGCLCRAPIELTIAIAIRPERQSTSEMSKMMRFDLEGDLNSILGPLTNIRNGLVYLVHQSAKDYLNMGLMSMLRVADTAMPYLQQKPKVKTVLSVSYLRKAHLATLKMVVEYLIISPK
jgi:hypothetical protein